MKTNNRFIIARNTHEIATQAHYAQTKAEAYATAERLRAETGVDWNVCRAA